MSEVSLLKGKKILVVDDEPDILAVLEELLDMCEIVKAASFEEAKSYMESRKFDIVVLILWVSTVMACWRSPTGRICRHSC